MSESGLETWTYWSTETAGGAYSHTRIVIRFRHDGRVLEVVEGLGDRLRDLEGLLAGAGDRDLVALGGLDLDRGGVATVFVEPAWGITSFVIALLVGLTPSFRR